MYIALIIVLSIFLRVNGHGSTLNSATTHIDLDWKAIVYRVCAKERAQWKYAMEKCASQMKVSATKELHQECAAKVSAAKFLIDKVFLLWTKFLLRILLFYQARSKSYCSKETAAKEQKNSAAKVLQ